MKKFTFLSLVLLVSQSFNQAKASTIHAVIDTVGNVCCCYMNNGFIIVTPSGGTLPYSYSWAPSGGTDSTANNLGAGTYTITVTDALGQTATASASVTQPACMVAAIGAPVNNTSCLKPNGSITVSPAGGVAPYTYLWAPTGQTNANATGLPAGSYTCTVKDNTGCSATASNTVGGTTAPILTVRSTADTGSCDGTVTATVTGGVSPYTYKWSPGGQTVSSLTGLCAGTYCCKVTDHTGCTDSNCVTVDTSHTICCKCGSNNIPASIASLGLKSFNVNVYPNPANTILNIVINNGMIGEADFYLIDALGRNVFNDRQKNVSSGFKESINIQSLQSGIYFLIIESNGQKLVKKVTKI